MVRVGLDWRPWARERDPAASLFELAVAMRAADYIERERRVERQNLANEIGGIVGGHVKAALTSIARAMR